MDFYQGSLPPNFISFCLESQNDEEPQIQTDTVADNLAGTPLIPAPTAVLGTVPTLVPSPPPFPPIRISVQSIQQAADITPANPDGHIETIASNDRPDQHKEGAQEPLVVGVPSSVVEGPNVFHSQDVLTAELNPGLVRASTPILHDQTDAGIVSLSQLESALTVGSHTQTDFPELHLASDVPHDSSRASFLQSEGETPSSVCEPPPLPGGTTHGYNVEELSDANQTGEGTSQTECPLLYSIIPFDNIELSSDGCEDLETTTHDPGQPGTSRSRSQLPDGFIRDLSGRSRATLKQYFEAEDPYTFPVGQRVVAFTEPQIYHILRVLTNEAIDMTCTTMERMVIGAVAGTPATVPSRTNKFLIRTRASTSKPSEETGSSSEGLVTEQGSGSEDHRGASLLQDVSDIPNLDDSDCSTEMALIEQTLRRTTFEFAPPIQRKGQPQDPLGEGTESAEKSSLDITLSEVRDQLPARSSRQRVSTSRSTRTKGVRRRGVPMREEFFSKIGWTRSFISGPADPLHNPYMVWCHMCKKNFSIKTKGTVEILRHHRSEKHLRRDQRWRYEHLKTTDQVTGKIHHRVRGRNGKILSKIELAREFPTFKHVELIDVGERFPFYEDYLKGNTSALVDPQSRAKTQICLAGDFIQSLGDLYALRKLWASAGSFTEYQTSFQDFDWSEEHVMVSSLGHSFIDLGVRTGEIKCAI